MKNSRGGRRPQLAAALPAALVLAWSLAGPVAAHAAPSPTGGQPTLTAQRTGALSPEGDVVTVTGRGYRPGVELRVLTCDPGQGPGQACDTERAGDPVRVGADGSFSREVRVRAEFGATDCLATRCAVTTSGTGDGGDASQEAYLPIGFRGEASGLPATASPASTPAPATGQGAAPSAQPPVSPSSSIDSATTPAQDNDADKNPWVLPIVIVGVIVVLALIAVYVLRNRRKEGTKRGHDSRR